MRATSGPALSRRFSLWLSCLLLGGLASCAPTYQLAVRPAQSTGLFVEGREQARGFADSVEVRLSFVRYEPTRLVFEAEYRNPTQQPVTVEPAAFAYTPTRTPAPALPKGQRLPRPAPGVAVTAAQAARRPLPPLPPQVRAFDPEAVLSGLNATAERAERKAGSAAALSLVFTLLTFTADVASIVPVDNPAKAQSLGALRDGLAATSVIAGASSVENAVVAEASRYEAGYLANHALRKVTLQPGQQVYGLVYFPRLDTADSLRLLVPTSIGPLPIDFVQTRKRE